MRHFLRKVFKTMKDVRCVVDCTEFHVQTSRNYARKETPTHLINMQTHSNASLLSHQMVVHALCPICLKEILTMCRYFENVE